MKQTLRSSMLILALCTLGGCATTGNGNEAGANDPLEGYNRVAFKFNDTLDTYALKPVAQTYKNYIPQFVQTGIGNFFGNLHDIYSAANGFLQGNATGGFTDVMRVAVNSTFGLFGVIDVASEARLQKQNRDFGQTLGRYGVGPGPYVVLPLLGPSTLRDTVALPADFYGDVWSYKTPVYIRNIGSGVRLVDKRAALLDATGLLSDAALDKYTFTRDTYMQLRQSQIEEARDPAGTGGQAETSSTDADAHASKVVAPTGNTPE
jgi:phospholipid-binding lipoprotein MlaA